MNKIVLADNLKYLKEIQDNSIDLIYVDPPFNTKSTQKRTKIKTILSEDGLNGFGGNKYIRENDGEYGSYEDSYEDYIGFIKPRLEEAYRVLKSTGTIYVHLDWREVHYVKIEMDKIFERDNFLNSIVWSYDYGAKSKKKWATKHDDILVYVKDKDNYTFNYDKVPRVPYLAPALAGPAKAAMGKAITDVWWHTIVPTNSKEKQNYSTQKPLGILRRIVEVSSNEGDLCLDFFAGSGTFGAACVEFRRNFIMLDNNPQAFEVMKKRFEKIDDLEVEYEIFQKD